MFRPQRVLITRTGTNEAGWDSVPGLVASSPSVGESLQLFLESGKWMRTSPITRIEHDGADLLVATRNSHYRLKMAA
jgi:hypothetical protein